jgi:hypothetical protein
MSDTNGIKFVELMQRYNLLGEALERSSRDLSDEKARADADMLLSEMRATQAQMDKILDEQRTLRQ